MSRKSYAETYTMRSRHYQLLGEAGKRMAEAFMEADFENQRAIRRNVIEAFEHYLTEECGYTREEIANLTDRE